MSEQSNIYIVGRNITAQGAYYHHRRVGDLRKVARGVYVNAHLDPDEAREAVRRNACRIAKELFSDAYLAGPSALHIGPVDGVLLLANPRWVEPTDVGGAFTIQTTKTNLDTAGLGGEVKFVEVEDDFGVMKYKAMSDEIVLIKNFGAQELRLTARDLNDLIERLLEEHGGDQKGVIDRLRIISGANNLTRWMPKVEAAIQQSRPYKQIKTEKVAYGVYWHESKVARLAFDGHIWTLDYDRNNILPLSLSTKMGQRKVPSFIGSILPEAGVKNDAEMEERFNHFEVARRFVSNINVFPESRSRTVKPTEDVLAGELADEGLVSTKLEFMGTVNPLFREMLTDDEVLKRCQRDSNTPRISGMQLKICANLSENGHLQPATNKSFTHIVKVPGANADYTSMGAVEWFTMTIAKLCELDVENFAIVDVGGAGPALLVERFDIRRNGNDKSYILSEELWSVMGMTVNGDKYKGDVLDVADLVMKYSTEGEKDAWRLFDLVAFSWLVGNSDLHLKNMMMIKRANRKRTGFESVRLSPIYDVMCSRVYPGDPSTAALTINGRRSYTSDELRALGRKLGLPMAQVNSRLTYLALAIQVNANVVFNNLPDVVQNHALSVQHIKAACAHFQARCKAMDFELQGGRSRLKVGGAQGNRQSQPEEESDEAQFSAHAEAELRRSEASNAYELDGGARAAGGLLERPRP